MNEKPYLFISYAHKDNESVLPIIGELKKQGFRLWYDDGIRAGAEWAEVIAEALYHSSVFLCFISGQYAASQNCKRELGFAISKNKQMVAIYLDTAELSLGMQMQLESVQAIPYRPGRTVDDLLRRLLDNDVMNHEALKMTPEEISRENESFHAPTLVSELTVAIGICTVGDKVVMVKRATGENSLVWQFPAAVVKPSEEIARKIVREVRQETGITVSFSHIIGKRIHPDTKAYVYYCALTYEGGEVYNGDDYENEDARLIPLSEYRTYITSDLAEEVRRYLEELS